MLSGHVVDRYLVNSITMVYKYCCYVDTDIYFGLVTIMCDQFVCVNCYIRYTFSV